MNLKKYYPFIVPAIALILVIFLAFRWYNLRTQRQDMANEDIQIETLTEEEEREIVQGTEDVSTVPLESEVEEPIRGQVRYRVQDDRVLVNVSADLPQEEGVYQVWVKPEDAEEPRAAFELTMNKGGYTGSGSLSADLLPLEVIVSQEMSPEDVTLETALLRGTIEPEAE